MTPSSLYWFGFLLLLSVNVYGAKLAPYLKACKVRTPDFKKCAVENGNAAISTIIKGDKTYGIPSFSPLHIPYVEFSSGDLKLNGTDTNIRGFEGVVLKDMHVDLDKKVIGIKAAIPEATLEINYNIGGKIAGLPLEGHGKGKIVVYDAIISYSFDYEEATKDGTKYIALKKDEFDITPQKLTIQLDNLFNGNKLLGDNTNKLLNENWPEVLKEFRPALDKIFGSIIRSILVPMTKKVPLNEIFLDY